MLTVTLVLPLPEAPWLSVTVTLIGYTSEPLPEGLSSAYWWLALSGMYFSYPLVAAANIYTSELYLITCMVIAYDMLARRRMGSPVPAKLQQGGHPCT